MGARFSVNEIARATGGLLRGGEALAPESALEGVSTDTRTLAPGQVFFALIGEKYDAHDHLEQAVLKGASMLVVSDAAKLPAGYEGAALVVCDTLRAYQDLAAYYRRRVAPFVVAVTGSVGKTTLKDMIACILAKRARTVWTKGNLNNRIGLPRTILEADEDTEILVLEMGMERAGEISRLADIARPDVAAITNIGVSHRENFDSDDGILKAKFEITAFMGAGNALALDISSDAEAAGYAADESLKKCYDLLRVSSAGAANAALADFAVTPVRVSEDDAAVSLFDIRDMKTGETVAFAVPVPGAYVSVSAGLAAAVCARAGVSLAEAARALRGLERTPHRLQPIPAGGALVIDDTYNASPDSAKSGLAYLKSLAAKRRIAVLADMNELGGASVSLHRAVGEAAAVSGADRIYTYGEKALWIADGAESLACAGAEGEARVFRFGPAEKEELIRSLRAEMREGDAIYVKGSRSMKMEEVVRALVEGV